MLRFVEAFLAAGVDGISLADTTGMANPRQVRGAHARACSTASRRRTTTFYTLHFHNTRGMGLANVLAGIEAGVRSFDGSIAGLGGCPFAPGATGNICTEDMVNMLQDMGYDTGVDLGGAHRRGAPRSRHRRARHAGPGDQGGHEPRAAPDSRIPEGVTMKRSARRLAARRRRCPPRPGTSATSARSPRTQFRLLSQDLGAALSYKGVTPATSLGPWGFDLGLELSSTDVKNSDIFRLAGARLDRHALRARSCTSTRGCGPASTSAASWPPRPTSTRRLWGVDVRYAFVAGHAHHAGGSPCACPAPAPTDLGSLKVSTYGADLMLSKRFTVATPYIGAGIVRIDSSISAPGLADETFNEGRYFGGVNLNLAAHQPRHRGRAPRRQHDAFGQAGLALLAIGTVQSGRF